MSHQYQNTNKGLTDQLNGASATNTGHLHHVNHSLSNIIQSGSFENENYRLIYNNPYQPQMESAGPLTSLFHTCFLGYVQNEGQDHVGPFVLNITTEEAKSLQIVDLDLDFVEEDQLDGHNSGRVKMIKTVQKKLEFALNQKRSSLMNNSKEFSKHVKERFSSGSLKLKITPLPFDNFYINSVKRRVPSVDSESQTVHSRDMGHRTEEDLINVLKEQINVLKDQNHLLRQQQAFNVRRTSGRPTREYVIRKQSQSTMKSTRDNSAASTDIVIESESIKSGNMGAKKKTLTNLTLLTNENSSLQEMLQEYMLENEALRQQNHSLEEVRASHHSELSMMSRKNKELTLKIDELSKRARDDSSRDPIPIDISESSKIFTGSMRESGGYPIMYEKTAPVNGGTSYLQQFDSLKNRHQNETAKRITSIPVRIKNEDESSVEKSNERITKPHHTRNLINDSLLEELSRIDVTIKEHIRKNQFNDTLRSMGKRQSPRKN